jgi:mannose-6-phosphate isomerase-like protein (cupin superfamily)
MPGYTIRNLREIDDAAVKFGLSPDVEARFAGRALESETVGLSLQRLAPNTHQPFGHSHREDEEIYVVTAGSGTVTLGEEDHQVRAWDAIRVAPDTTRVFAAGPEGLEFLAFGGNSGTDDVESFPAG